MHEDGCIIEHDVDESECFTRDDALAARADQRYDEMKDGER